MQKINLSNDTAERLAGLRASDSPFANTIAAALDNVAIGLTPESSLASAIEAAADLDSNAALARTALHGRTEFLAKLAESAANISGSMNGRNMAESDIPAAQGLAGELERLAFGLAESNWPTTYAALCQIGAQGIALTRTAEAESRVRRCAADSLTLCDTQRRNLAESRYLAARNVGDLLGALVAALRVSSLPDIQRNAESLTVAICQLEIDAGERDKAGRAAEERNESYRAQRDAEGERANKAEALAASRLAEAAEFRGKHMDASADRDGWRERAIAAERQLAEYRSLMSALPAGVALRFPAALPLLRAYLADAESGK